MPLPTFAAERNARQLRVTRRHIGARGQHARTGWGGHIAGRGSRSALIAKAAFGHGLRASYRLCVVGELRHPSAPASADNLAAGGTHSYPGFQVRAAALLVAQSVATAAA